MKEPTIEEKARRYDEAIEVARKIKNGEPINVPDGTLIPVAIFPELKESGDERVRNKLIEFFKGYSPDKEWWENITQEDILAWLEKQGHTDSIIEKAKTEKQRVIITETDGNANIDWNTRSLEDARRLLGCGLQCINTELEKQGNTPKEATYTYEEVTGNGNIKALVTEKVQLPKFKVGDKIRIKTPSSCDKDMQVARIEKDYYICNHIGKFSSEVVPFSKESCYELIEQKSVDNVESSAFKDKLSELFQRFRWRCLDNTPTNGEILEYVDANIQELIDTVQNKSWSEEDELHIRELESLVKQVWATAEQKNDKDTIHKMSDLSFFLKTLKPQNQWKPSDEQMDAIKDAIDYLGCNTKKVREYLMSLHEQLKKLREE